MKRTQSGLSYILKYDKQSRIIDDEFVGYTHRLNLKAEHNNRYYYLLLLEVNESEDGTREFVKHGRHQLTLHESFIFMLRDVWGASFPLPASCVVTDSKIVRYKEMVEDVLDSLHKFVKGDVPSWL